MVEEQPHTFGHIAGRRPQELVRQMDSRRRQSIAETLEPRPTVLRSQTEVEEEAEVLVVGLEVAVVEGLRVVGIGSRFEKQASQPGCVLMGWLVSGVLAQPEGAGEGSERIGAVPQVAGIGICATLDEQPSAGEARSFAGIGNSGEGDIKQWGPLEDAGC